MQTFNERFYPCVLNEYPKCDVLNEISILKKMYREGMHLILKFAIKINDKNTNLNSQKLVEEISLMIEITILKYFPRISKKSKRYMCIRKILLDSFKYSIDVYNQIEPMNDVVNLQ